MYLAATPLLFIGSVGVATAQNVPQLLIGRFIQTFGASPGFSVGAGVIGDIYKLEERGAAMGTYFAVCKAKSDNGLSELIYPQAILLGPALAPLAGGMSVTSPPLHDFTMFVTFSDRIGCTLRFMESDAAQSRRCRSPHVLLDPFCFSGNVSSREARGRYAPT